MKKQKWDTALYSKYYSRKSFWSTIPFTWQRIATASGAGPHSKNPKFSYEIMPIFDQKLWKVMLFWLKIMLSYAIKPTIFKNILNI